MAVSDEQVKQFESQYKELLFSKISEMSSKQAELISVIKKVEEFSDIEADLPNIGITLNNKLVELGHTFEEAGLSIYSSKIEDYGPLKLNLVSPSIIGEAIIDNMISKAKKGTEALQHYDSSMGKIEKKKQEKVQALEKAGPIKSFFLKLRGLVFPAKQIDLSYTQEETTELNSYLSEYRKIDEQLWNYSLRDNIVPSLVDYIKPRKYSMQAILEDITPDLQKLGLADLMPQLQEELEKEFAKNKGNSWQLSDTQKAVNQEAQKQIAQTYSSVNLGEQIKTTEKSEEISHDNN